MSDPLIIPKTMFLKENGSGHKTDICKTVGIDTEMSAQSP